MTGSEIVAEVWRGDFLECVHRGHAVICDVQGNVRAAWGDPSKAVLPRSSCKMLQALPLIESGAAKEFGLGAKHLALACASHQGAAIHTDRVTKWLDHIGLSESDLRCGGHQPHDEDARKGIYCGDHCIDQTHNNCSGKHAGFLTLNKHLDGGSEYNEVDHPVQKAIKTAIEEMASEDTQGHVIDGCSAPNFAVSLKGLAHSMARMADPRGLGDTRETAARSLVEAMGKHPELVAGETRACTDLMRAMDGKVAVKTGAEGVFIAILPEQGLGVALKIEDGATRASEAAIAALLVRLGVADANNPLVKNRLFAEQRNCNDFLVGSIRPSDAIYKGGVALS
ncbi:asparaginase [Amylibacter sp. SFDW26]|uniref:asparaginase n=1 Tax=Amylibacter sp. SFDW26 TaxID=2652722 RepID=UPI0012621840|nr:asparaginase [Amylibacter sp. SFDW26]KAB7614523.1 asparaginase [Amylibacter sp. SFDW26]